MQSQALTRLPSFVSIAIRCGSSCNTRSSVVPSPGAHGLLAVPAMWIRVDVQARARNHCSIGGEKVVCGQQWPSLSAAGRRLPLRGDPPPRLPAVRDRPPRPAARRRPLGQPVRARPTTPFCTHASCTHALSVPACPYICVRVSAQGVRRDLRPAALPRPPPPRRADAHTGGLGADASGACGAAPESQHHKSALPCVSIVPLLRLDPRKAASLASAMRACRSVCRQPLARA